MSEWKDHPDKGPEGVDMEYRVDGATVHLRAKPPADAAHTAWEEWRLPKDGYFPPEGEHAAFLAGYTAGLDAGHQLQDPQDREHGEEHGRRNNVISSHTNDPNPESS